MGRMFVWEQKYLSLCTVLGNGGIAWHLSPAYLQILSFLYLIKSKCILQNMALFFHNSHPLTSPEILKLPEYLKLNDQCKQNCREQEAIYFGKDIFLR